MLSVAGSVLQVSDAPKVGGGKSCTLSQPHVPALPLKVLFDCIDDSWDSVVPSGRNEHTDAPLDSQFIASSLARPHCPLLRLWRVWGMRVLPPMAYPHEAGVGLLGPFGPLRIVLAWIVLAWAESADGCRACPAFPFTALLGAGHVWSDLEVRCARSQSCCSLTSLFSGSWLLCGPRLSTSRSLVQHSQLFVQGMFLCQAESGCFLVAGEVANPRCKMPRLG